MKRKDNHNPSKSILSKKLRPINLERPFHSLRSPRSGRLCDRCTQIPLSLDRLHLLDPDHEKSQIPVHSALGARSHDNGNVSSSTFAEKEPSKPWDLGLLLEVRMRSCSFCSFLARTINSDVGDSRRLFLYWERRHRPFCFTAGGSLLPKGITIAFLDIAKPSIPINCAIRICSDWIDIAIPKRYLATCRKEHTATCEASLSQHESRSPACMQRVVDLQEMSIIKTPKNCEYATLSYVWGDASDGRLVLHSENMQVLEKSGSLTKRWDDIPCTICDAITFTQRMGYKYLWVDSLCLVQNDETEMDNAMRRMDLVFRKSSFTIVAATGEGAHHGLPGVGEIPRKCNKSEIEVNCGICLTTIATLDPLLDKTKYATRAWTMQEQLCGTRLLVFINDQIYFQRQKATWSEETTISNRPLAALHREWPRRSLFLTDASSFDDAFRGFLEYYGVREVSKSQDALRAASGVLRRLSEKYRVNFQHGIPLPLHRYLLLLSSGANKRREGHPSYSWTGWTKSLQVYKFEHPAKNMSTWIVWYCLTEKGVFVCDSASRPHQLTIPDNEFLSNAPNFPVVTPIQEVHSAAPLAAMLCKEYDLLVFWTLYINIRLEDYYHVGKQDHGGTRPMGDDGPLRHRVIDTDGNVSGFVMLDNHDVDTQKPQEIALISEAKSRRGRKEYYFLLLDWNGDIAERRGVGSLSRSLKEAFLLQPVGKRIILG